MNKPIPKSLHTVTVLIKLAAHLASLTVGATPRECVNDALEFLGYDLNDDAHSLASAARKILSKGI